MYRSNLIVIMLSLLFLAFAVQAQDFAPGDDLTTASVTLEAGFVLDPYLVRVLGGGSMPAADVDESCPGFVRPEPNFTLNWSGETAELHLLTYSDDDMVLVVEIPGGDIVCNDDADLSVLDALVTLEQPAAGEYKVWVGAFEADMPTVGFLVVTEVSLELNDLDLMPLLLRDEDPAVADVVMLEIEEVAVFGVDNLRAGFDAVRVPAAGGGDLAISTVETGNDACAGFASVVPTYSFSLAGESEGVRVIFETEEESSLVVLAPDGEFLCDGAAVDIERPIAGEYDVFVASVSPDAIVTGTLTLTEDLSN